MIERCVIAAAAEDPGLEAPAATRERLKDYFPRGATRRMTQLGLLIGSVLRDQPPRESDVVIYASQFAENQALEEYLASFPTPSPTLFQTSIHPSAVQQVLIARQQPVREVFPLTGGHDLGTRMIELAFVTPGDRVVICGGEERGTWLREVGSASEETFAFALSLSANPAGAMGVLRERAGVESAPWSLKDLWQRVRDRQNGRTARFELEWR
ncbi:MAG TPA: hypothetical protein VGL42_14010 [Opitutaceae bacterium]|jgi:hypothetical protein